VGGAGAGGSFVRGRDAGEGEAGRRRHGRAGT
jgi:hypothetical protein